MRPFHALLVKWILWRQIRTSGAKSTLQCNSTSCRINSKSKRIPTRQEFIEKEETKQNKKNKKMGADGKWNQSGAHLLGFLFTSRFRKGAAYNGLHQTDQSALI